MKCLWKYISLFFAGIIGGLVAAIKILDPKTEITASTYVKEQNQETTISKVKNKGDGTTQNVTQSPNQSASDTKLSRKEKRLKRKEKRKAKRNEKSVLSEDKK